MNLIYKMLSTLIDLRLNYNNLFTYVSRHVLHNYKMKKIYVYRIQRR